MKPNIEGYIWKNKIKLKIKSKTNNNEKIDDQIWYINKMTWHLLILIGLVWIPRR